MGLSVCLRYTRLILLDVCLNLFNLAISLTNIQLFLQKEETEKFGYLSLFFMWYPGIVTSVGFLILYFRGVRAISELEVWKIIVYPLSLLILYPVLPVLLTLYYLFKNEEQLMKRARLIRLFASFLDHGPQFILRVVVVVLIGIPHFGVYDRGDVKFILSMVSSFLSLVLSALVFNERQASNLVWMFLSAPMFAAIFGGRAFTLAVLVREVLEEGTPVYEYLLYVLFILVIVVINIAIFRWCGQDWIRSTVFGMTSLIIPTGYTNDAEYYQLPGQNLLEDQNRVKRAPRLRTDISREDGVEHHEMQKQLPTEPGDQVDKSTILLAPMQSGKFLLTHIKINTVFLGLVSIYLYVHSERDNQVDEALVLPQVLCVIPGLLFGLGRGILHIPSYDDNKSVSQRTCGACQAWAKVYLAGIFSFLGFVSVVPAIVMTFFYKLLTT